MPWPPNARSFSIPSRRTALRKDFELSCAASPRALTRSPQRRTRLELSLWHVQPSAPTSDALHGRGPLPCCQPSLLHGREEIGNKSRRIAMIEGRTAQPGNSTPISSGGVRLFLSLGSRVATVKRIGSPTR